MLVYEVSSLSGARSVFAAVTSVCLISSNGHCTDQPAQSVPQLLNHASIVQETVEMAFLL